MRLGVTPLSLIMLAVAGVLSVLAAIGAATAVETVSQRIVAEALARDGQDWAGVETDGLQVILTGRAPSEALRFRARTVAARVVDGTRVLDGMDVIATDPLAPPAFSVEMLNNEGGLQLIGLVPDSYDLPGLMRTLSEQGASITDLLETAEGPIPQGWGRALDYAVTVLPTLPRAKISVSADEVRITAIADSPEHKARLEANLTRRAPDDLRLALDIGAPRPVISPYTVRFVLEPGVDPRFDACAAETEEARDRILTAARRAGLQGKAACTIGLGAPGPNWADAVSEGIAAVATLGGGAVTLSDTRVALRALPGTDPTLFDRVTAELGADLPEIYALTSVLPELPQESEDDGPPEFIATRAPEGQVQLRGTLTDALTRQAVESLARARFGAAQVYAATRLDDRLPVNWGLRVLAGLEALEVLERGALIVTPDDLSLRGVTEREDGRAEAARILADRLGQGAAYRLDITYTPPRVEDTSGPSAEECVARIAGLIEERKITFDPGSTVISAEAIPTVSAIADVLKDCRAVDMEIEIAGHTDSQGREEMNRNLSQARADAVLDALAARRVLTGNITARGYGEDQPIADNGTEEGREANRRIEFRLIVDDEVALDTGAEALEEAAEEQAAEDTGAQQDPAPETSEADSPSQPGQQEDTAAEGGAQATEDSPADSDAQADAQDAGAAPEADAPTPDADAGVPEDGTAGDAETGTAGDSTTADGDTDADATPDQTPQTGRVFGPEISDLRPQPAPQRPERNTPPADDADPDTPPTESLSETAEDTAATGETPAPEQPADGTDDADTPAEEGPTPDE